ncbi:hypothetical protein KL86CLO1_13401 [uncultured Eubacteriales bacterium]|uniref:Uncharacterized protein n=1 Tax=uncultured Eubacteriales bacterium TaxID=172733 RepID=A0A212KJF7_9FIRM|nr:hypothetical protein KL86CLO1_13401 [uncultured Eubacteriales bacterium]
MHQPIKNAFSAGQLFSFFYALSIGILKERVYNGVLWDLKLPYGGKKACLESSLTF